ncbi:ABC transporter permease [Puia sp. P3]|uniref:ABC transporter permease n=1 Tax=Puia sp. P3 TaxID=3423952 RepID=UPI003D6653C7
MGYDFLETLGMKMVDGRTFSRDFGSDSNARASVGAASTRSSSPVISVPSIIFNETAVRKLGLDPKTAAGTTIHFGHLNDQQDIRIVGVVKDFNFQSLRDPIRPYGFMLTDEKDYLIARVRTADYGRLLGDIGGIWQRINPGTPFEYSFLDQDFQRSYEQEYRIGRIIGVFTALTIFIACLGLLGLAAFSAEQRVREIGIRKVLGCSVFGIIALLSKDFVRLVVVAICIASPLAWLAMWRWLQDFSYRVPIYWWLFVVAGGGAVFIALSTVGWQAVRAARVSPVKSLRAE